MNVEWLASTKPTFLEQSTSMLKSVYWTNIWGYWYSPRPCKHGFHPLTCLQEKWLSADYSMNPSNWWLAKLTLASNIFLSARKATYEVMCCLRTSFFSHEHFSTKIASKHQGKYIDDSESILISLNRSFFWSGSRFFPYQSHKCIVMCRN